MKLNTWTHLVLPNSVDANIRFQIEYDRDFGLWVHSIKKKKLLGYFCFLGNILVFCRKKTKQSKQQKHSRFYNYCSI